MIYYCQILILISIFLSINSTVLNIETNEFVIPEYSKNIQEAASDEGTIAGLAAGKKSGEFAGEKSATIYLTTHHIKTPRFQQATTSINNVLPSQTNPEVWEEIRRKNPGAVQYFIDFDADHDGYLSKEEFWTLLRSAQEKHYIASSFDPEREWSSLHKQTNGKLSLEEFLYWANRTPAHTPIPNKSKHPMKPETVDTTSRLSPQKFRSCSGAFKFYDKDHSNGLTLEEFKSAVSGRVADDTIPGIFYERANTKTHLMDERTWIKYCQSLLNLPVGPNKLHKKTDPCLPNPCPNVGDYCVPYQDNSCSGNKCAQYKCVKSQRGPKPRLGVATAFTKCIKMFNKFDKDKSKTLSMKEFKIGVENSNKNKIWDIKDAWAHFNKYNNEVTERDFVDFCVSSQEEAEHHKYDGNEAECWDVFKTWDKNGDDKISQDEFKIGFKHAQIYGHIKASLNWKQVFNAFPKDKNMISSGSFLSWCIDVSRGIDYTSAAAASVKPLKLETTTYMSSAYNNTNGTIIETWSNGTTISYYTNGIIQYKYSNGSILTLKRLTALQGVVITPQYEINQTNTKEPSENTTVTFGGTITTLAPTPAPTSAPTPLPTPIPTPSTTSNSTSNDNNSTNSNSSTIINDPNNISTLNNNNTQLNVATSIKNSNVFMKAVDDANNAMKAFLNKAKAKASLLAGVALGTSPQSTTITPPPPTPTPPTVIATPENICEKWFTTSDVDNRGWISIHQYQPICDKIHGSSNCQHDYAKYFLKANTASNGMLSKVDFKKDCIAGEFTGKTATDLQTARSKVSAQGAEEGKKAGAEAGGIAGSQAGSQAAIKTVEYNALHSSFKSADPQNKNPAINNNIEKTTEQSLSTKVNKVLDEGDGFEAALSDDNDDDSFLLQSNNFITTKLLAHELPDDDHDDALIAL